uniref:CWH43-like N-terminal domain-containing protein n=1 Tax=Anopheles culicifacies TaxID=139723 RepID=A0A182ML88_9DIPT
MSKLYLLPITVFLLFNFTFIGTYIAAVLQGHVVPTVPYISDAATYSPESCVFGQFINMGCVLLGITIYVRYRQIQELSYRHSDVRQALGRYSGISFWIGIGSCLGISIVGNFQETNVRIVHYVGAFLSFGLGTVYFWIQSYISYYIQPYMGTMQKANLRMALSVVCTIFFMIVAVTGVISHILFRGTDPRKWYPSDGGWEYHVASSISEWIVATAFCFYVLTFTDEFRTMQFDHPPLILLEIDSSRSYEPVISDTPVASLSRTTAPDDERDNDDDDDDGYQHHRPVRSFSDTDLKLLCRRCSEPVTVGGRKRSPAGNGRETFPLRPSTGIIVRNERAAGRSSVPNPARSGKFGSLTLSLMLVALMEALHSLTLYFSDSLRQSYI